VQPLLRDSPEAFLLVDDGVQDKRYSKFMELAKRQYPGNAHGMVTGIGLVNLGHSSGEAGDSLPLDYRVYAPDGDQLTKNDHFLAMFEQVVAGGKVLARPALTKPLLHIFSYSKTAGRWVSQDGLELAFEEVTSARVFVI